jgi:hypothetical protein
MNKICYIKVNKETSPLVQELLFSYGWKWATSGKNILYLDYPYLCIYDDKDICHSAYKDSGCIELSFAELLEYLKTGKVPKKQIKFSSNDIDISIQEKVTLIIDGNQGVEIPNSLILEIAEKIKCF